MAYQVIIKEQAKDDTQTAYDHYEGQLQQLGEEFLEELVKRYDDIADHPTHYGFIDNQHILRDIRLHRFPYVVVFEIIDFPTNHMATPRKKKKPALRKAKTTSTADARKAGSKAGRPSGSEAAGRKPVAGKSAAGTAAGGAGKRVGKAGAVTAREKLIAVRPSGGKDDSFFDLVHEVARQIPRGRVTSFGAIGAALGTRSSARMVGWAMNACHLSSKPVPAHRVVNSVGLLTGRHHFKPPEKMQLLLEKEGVVVQNNKVVDFQKLFWDPSKEL